MRPPEGGHAGTSRFFPFWGYDSYLSRTGLFVQQETRCVTRPRKRHSTHSNTFLRLPAWSPR